MRPDTHYEVDFRKTDVGVREEGIAFCVEDQLGIDNLYGLRNLANGRPPGQRAGNKAGRVVRHPQQRSHRRRR